MSRLPVCLLVPALALAGCSFGMDSGSVESADAEATEVAGEPETPEAEAVEPEGLTGATISDVRFGPGIGIENGHLRRTGERSWTFTFDNNGQSFELVETESTADRLVLVQNGGLNMQFVVDLAGNRVLQSVVGASNEIEFPITSAT